MPLRFRRNHIFSRHAATGLLAVLVLVATSSAEQLAPRLKQPDVRYVPTPQHIVDLMLDLARVTAADVVYDLGSGDGRIPITAARRFGARGVGVEIDPLRVRDANDNLVKSGVHDRVWFLNQDLFDADISQATVVTLFLLPQLNQRLIPKLKRELKPGSRVVSYLWDMGAEWPADRTTDVDGWMIYLWTIKAVR